MFITEHLVCLALQNTVHYYPCLLLYHLKVVFYYERFLFYEKNAVSLYGQALIFVSTTKTVEVLITPVLIGVSQRNKLHLFVLLFLTELTLKITTCQCLQTIKQDQIFISQVLLGLSEQNKVNQYLSYKKVYYYERSLFYEKMLYVFMNKSQQNVTNYYRNKVPREAIFSFLKC